MKRIAIAACCLSMSLVAGAAAAQAGASTGTSTTTVPPESSASAASYRPAVRSLQQARKTLAALTEESMSKDARSAVAGVADNFRALYKAYTGAEPDERKSTAQLRDGHSPDPSWKADYTTLTSSLDALIGPRTAGTAGYTGATSPAATAGTGTTASTSGNIRHMDLPKTVQDDLQHLRQQLASFERAADAKGKQGTRK